MRAGFLTTGTGDLSTPYVTVPPRERRARFIGMGWCTSGFPEVGLPGFLAIFTGLLTRNRWLLLDDLGLSPFGGELLVVMAALVTAVSQVPLMTFFPGILSAFLAYLYTWYCFLALFSLENKMQMIPLEAFYSGLGYT